MSEAMLWMSLLQTNSEAHVGYISYTACVLAPAHLLSVSGDVIWCVVIAGLAILSAA